MKIKDILIQILLILWQLPQCLVGLIMLPFLGKLRLIRYENYCWIFEGEKMSGGISLGCFIFLSKYSAKKETTILHELGHVKQSHILGPIYLFIIGIPSILWATFGDKDKCYYSFYTEKGANYLMNLGVNFTKYGCNLYIIDDEN
jgi:hypothetical protein